MIKNVIIILITLISFFTELEVKCSETSAQNGTFLSNGVLYTYDFANNSKSVLINTSDSIVKYIVSPNQNYIAYEKHFKHIRSAGIYENEEDRPLVPINSIVVWDLSLKKKIKEIEPEKAGLYHIKIEKWIDNDVLLIGESGAYDFDGYLTYTLNEGIKKYGYKHWKMHSSFYIAIDNSSEVFIDKTNKLNIVDRKNRIDTLFLNWDLKVDNIYISPQKKYLVWFTKEKYFDENSLLNKNRRNVNILNLGTDSTFIIHSIKNNNAMGKGAGYINFSPDGDYLGIGEANHFFIYKILSGENTVINGYNFVWISNNKLVLNKDGNLYIYSTLNSKIELLAEEACCFQIIK